MSSVSVSTQRVIEIVEEISRLLGLQIDLMKSKEPARLTDPQLDGYNARRMRIENLAKELRDELPTDTQSLSARANTGC
jgi:hypothetical protein